MDEISARVAVPPAKAAELSSNPDLALGYMQIAEDAMNEKAAERGRVVSAPPRLVSANQSTLADAVELEFVAPTRPR